MVFYNAFICDNQEKEHNKIIRTNFQSKCKQFCQSNSIKDYFRNLKIHKNNPDLQSIFNRHGQFKAEAFESFLQTNSTSPWTTRLM